MEELKNTVVVYHGNCYDGFGAAWSAWRKFGDQASYLPFIFRDKYPENIKNREVYVLDFCFNELVTEKLVKNNKKVIIVDHHISNREIVESIPGHVFSLRESGAKLAWKYFHVEKDIPELIEYLSDSDTWAHALPNWREIEGYIHSSELSFNDFDDLYHKIKNEKQEIIKIGTLLNRNFDKQVKEHIEKAILVKFDGNVIFACNAPAFIRSELGHVLAKKKGPFSIVYRYEGDLLKVSLRGDGSVDVSKIAQKYGGGGHHDAAGIIFENVFSLPFCKIFKE